MSGWKRASEDMQWATRERRGVGGAIDARPVPRPTVVEGAASRRYLDRDELRLRSVGGGGPAQFGVRVGRSVELLDHPPAPAPAVRARTYSTVPCEAVVSSRAIQQLTHSEGTAHCS